ncbi:hypothetical protein [Paucibacter sp. Y2R2-4]|uniref:hypothetical protein n=1 Tax=Paucibacter sp. Y2R2-4 TaxID=2893553 RepID=UPI0021E450AC|nr:hypothetical protein [Paucibacter sp. Y2R2-4]MCV2351986.1 hypothetical protein [Paucibacter sp. Y2R2-4]
MASAKTNNGQLPPGFVSPFKRVEMKGTHDDLLACAAILCGKSMEDVKKMAVTLGMPANGPFFMSDMLFRQIAFNLSPLAVSEYKDLTATNALPEVAVLCVDYDKHSEACRHVVFHQVRASEKTPAFGYVIDPANWLTPDQHITIDLSHLNLKPAWYLEITQRPGTTPIRSSK